MSDLLAIGLTGLTAYRTALSAVGENVANAETPGYSRRSVRLEPALASTAADPIYRDSFQFGGVRATAIVRAWDEFRAAETRYAASAAGRGEVREQWLTGVETALDDGEAGVGSQLTGLFNAVDALAAAPGDVLSRSRMLMAVEDAAGAFRATGGALMRVSEGIQQAAQLDVTRLNDALAALADNNRTLLTTAPGGTGRASLEDQRDRLIDSVASEIGVNVTIAENGTATLRTAEAPNTLLLGGGELARFTVSAAADGRLNLQVTTSSGTTAITPLTGRLAGYLEASAATADRRAALDTLATDFAADLNAWSAAGRDSAGAAGQALLSVTEGAASMRHLIDDPALVPAASADGRPNGNLLALAALRGPNGSERRWTGIVAGNAQQLAAAKSEHAAAQAWRENSFAALDETTGINLDREAADLLRFQQAYSAAARIIQVGRETFNDLLNAI
jgi:flagellar hook-associated protein 1 FlgK